MRANEVMTAPAITVSPKTAIRAAGRMLLDRNVTALPVVNEEGSVVGIVSRTDLLRNRVVADPRAHFLPVPEDTSEPPRTVADVMTTDVVTLRPYADEAEAARLMLQHRIKSIPVVDADRLLGIVSVTDILRAKVRSDSSIARDVRERLVAYAGDEGCWDVTVEDGVVTISTWLPSEKRRVLLLLAETVPGVVRVRLDSPRSSSARGTLRGVTPAAAAG